jgi:4-hydroxy-tetrahydrodipicolinate reductase
LHGFDWIDLIGSTQIFPTIYTVRMRFLLLGAGKTGSLVAEVACDRHHEVELVRSEENPRGSALTADRLRVIDAVIDFTTPSAVMENIPACLSAGKPMVVGTTGWYERLPEVRSMAENSGTAFVFGANFSVGVNLLLDIARTASAATQHGYSGQIFERHHVHKKDAPSGTAIAIQNAIRGACGQELEITSFREGEVVGMHEVILDSPYDRIYLYHDAKSRRGFAEGTVRAAEWIVGKKGFFDFKDVWREV